MPFAVRDTGTGAIHNLRFDRVYTNRDYDFDVDGDYDTADVEVDAGDSFVLGYMFARTNYPHNIEYGQKMFVTKAGHNSSGPVLSVLEGYHAGRGGAFGPPRTLRRSIAGSIGYFSRTTWHHIHASRAQRHDKSGPRQGQLYKKKVMIYAIEDLHGFVESNNAQAVPVVAIWRT